MLIYFALNLRRRVPAGIVGTENDHFQPHGTPYQKRGPIGTTFPTNVLSA